MAPRAKITTTNAGSSPLVSGQIVMAQMTFFVVDETKLDTLTEKNDEAKSFWAASSAFISFAVGLLTCWAFADHLTALGQVASFLGAPICIAASIFCACRAKRIQKTAGGLLTKIKSSPRAVTMEFTLNNAKNP